MSSLIKKDFYIIQKSMLTQFIILAVLGTVLFGFLNRSTSGVAGFMVSGTVVMTMQLSTVFTLDDKNKFKKQLLVMPVTTKDIVSGKYFLGLLLGLTGLVSTGIVYLVVGKINNNFDFLDFFVNIALSITYAIYITGVTVPLLIKHGNFKAWAYLLFLIVVPVSIIIGFFVITSFMDIDESILNKLVLLLPIIASIFTFITYKRSLILWDKYKYEY